MVVVVVQSNFASYLKEKQIEHNVRHYTEFSLEVNWSCCYFNAKWPKWIVEWFIKDVKGLAAPLQTTWRHIPSFSRCVSRYLEGWKLQLCFKSLMQSDGYKRWCYLILLVNIPKALKAHCHCVVRHIISLFSCVHAWHLLPLIQTPSSRCEMRADASAPCLSFKELRKLSCSLSAANSFPGSASHVADTLTPQQRSCWLLQAAHITPVCAFHRKRDGDDARLKSERKHPPALASH